MEKTKNANKLLGDDGVKAAVEFQRHQNEMKANFEGIVQVIGRDFMPLFDRLMVKMQEFWEKHGKQITAFIERLITDLVPKLIMLLDGAVSLLDRLTGGGSTPSGSSSSGLGSLAQSISGSPLLMAAINAVSPLAGTAIQATAIGSSLLGGGGQPSSPASGGAVPGGTLITTPTTNVYTINVQNPITANSDIPSTVQYLQMMNGGSN